MAFLPPEAVDAFLADNTTDAYEKLVDRLLGHPVSLSAWPSTG